MMWLGVLGPLLVEQQRRVPVEVPAGKQRVLLAALLMSPNRVVSYEALARALWQDEPPATARVTTRNYVRRLRETVGAEISARIVTRNPGYLIEVGEDEYDLLAFDGHCRRGRDAARAGRWQQATHAFDQALTLWRGEPLLDVPSESLRRAHAGHVTELRLQALESRLEAALRLGAAGELVADLRRLASEHPLRERFHAQLILALYRAGRQGEALETYLALRRALAEELGIDPGPELRELHARILRNDPTLLPPPGLEAGPARPATTAESLEPLAPDPTLTSEPSNQDTTTPARVPLPLTPRQLPIAPRYFAGRVAELKTLGELLPDVAADTGGEVRATAVVSAISGTAGIGKTALALYWAHQVADRFPDGQLYVNLRGFDSSGQPVRPAEAIRGFLDAFGIPVTQIPAELETQAALYRSVLADRRVLIVLDNARDIDQIRPLLPGRAPCLVLVTSRSQLVGLVASEGAELLNLDVLRTDEARDLLDARLSTNRIAAHPSAADELIALCAGLPLALTIVAARAAVHATFPLDALASELRSTRSRLDALDIGDPTTDVRAAVSWSYRSLSPAAARMFRLLGVHAGPDISAAAAASLAGASPDQTRRALGELIRVNLLTQHLPGRFVLHDLLRDYAAEQAADHDTEMERSEAVHRVLDHYLRTGDAAVGLLDPTRDAVRLPVPPAGVTAERLADAERARDWFAAEYRVLVTATEQALTTGFYVYAWQIPCVMSIFFDRQGHWHDWVSGALIGLEAARRLDNRRALARIHRVLGIAYTGMGAHDDARTHYTRSLELCDRLGDHVAQAHACRGLAQIAELGGRDDLALEHDHRALALYRQAGHRSGQAQVLNDLGWSHAQRNDFVTAVRYCERALVLQRELGDVDGQAATWDSLGYAHRRLGHHGVATMCYRNAFEIYRQLDDRYRQARTLIRLGEGSQAAGESDVAREQWQRALVILDMLGHREAGEVRAKLGDPG